MIIPSEFKVAGNTIKVEWVDNLDSSYGNYCDATNTITLAKNIIVDGSIIKLTEDQMLNTFFHEMYHAFQFYHNTNYDEGISQVYANFTVEFTKTKKNDN